MRRLRTHSHVSRSGRRGRVLGPVALALMLALPAVTLAQTAPASPADWNTHLTIGPVEGLTNLWHQAPKATAIPLGTTVHLQARGYGAISWTGAEEVDRSAVGSTAEHRFDRLGEHVVTMQLFRGQGDLVEESIVFEVVDRSPREISLSPIRVSADELVIDPANPNASTMDYFFRRDSIAAVRDLGGGRYRTSVDRVVTLEVDVEPAGFAPLVEWRLGGVEQRHLGSPVRLHLIGPGEQRVAAGPLGLASEIEIETYEVRIVPPESWAEATDGVPLTFEAVTDPAGFEDEVRWLASTKYGACQPLTGAGREFTTVFDRTAGAAGRWLGVRADEATIEGDGNGNGGPLNVFTGSLTTDAGDFRIELDLESSNGCVAGTWGLTLEDGTLLGDGTVFGTQFIQTLNLSLKPLSDTNLIADLDSDGSLAGSVFENGIPVGDVFVHRCSGPDLTFDLTRLTAFPPLSLCDVDEGGNSQIVIRNQGDSASQATVLNGTLSCADGLEFPETIVDNEPIEALESGETKVFVIDLPPDCEIATLILTIEAVQGECSETNNISNSRCIPPVG